MKNYFLLLCFSFYVNTLFAQQKVDSLKTVQKDSTLDLKQELNEVIIIGNSDANYLQQSKSLGSIDGYLEESNSINMVRRGAYAGEPLLNGMSTERSVITIDGMRIFHACTDKMDPITSYVENTNLSEAKITDGQSGASYGGTIAGNIDLIRKKSNFSNSKKISGSLFSGFESNNLQQNYGATGNYSQQRFFVDADFTYRNAKNYKAGYRANQNSEVNYSQYTKYNASTTIGYKINNKQQTEAAFIFDKATNVGYPGLPMDVALAQAAIASAQHTYRDITEYINLWETKLYYNNITHVMDDSHRPIVPIRMDMPGWTKTKGFYSKITGSYNYHFFKTTLSAYSNNSLAEMTMHPNDPKEKDMFMLTWPDVNTNYAGINIEDNIVLNPHLTLALSGGVGVNQHVIKSELGLNSLQLFFPDLTAKKIRSLKNLSSHLSYHHCNFLHKIGFAYGDRAPSVSEGYGFYLLNVNDNYDYVGNPNLKNEKSFNVNASSNFTTNKLAIKAKLNYFYIIDYIIGKPRLGVAAMNITANGIKMYEQLNNASLFNSGLTLDYNFFSNWFLSSNASYRYGQGSKNTILPLIQPLSYKLKIKYNKENFFAEAAVEGSSKNRNSTEFGETQKPAFAVVNAAISKSFLFKEKNIVVKVGAENLFNHYYSTFDNWFGIPRMGRNIYTNIIFKF